MKFVHLFAIPLATPIFGLPQEIRPPGLHDETTRWQDITCDFGALSNAANHPLDQWNDAKASEAFAEAIENYKTKNEQHLGFSNSLANYFKAIPGINCGQLDNSACNTPINCGQGNAPNAAVNSPAGYMIVNSMVYLHQHYEAQYNGLNNALNYIGGRVGNFAKVFAPQIDPMKGDKILIDVLLMGFGVLSAFNFNSWMKHLPYFSTPKGGEKNKNNLGELKDVTNNWMTQGLNIYKDNMTALDKVAVQNNIEEYLTTVVHSWVNATAQNLEYFMNESPDDLLKVIDNGKMWDISKNKPDALDVTADVMKTLFSIVIPYAWKLSTIEVGAFIATKDGVEGKEGDCYSYDPAKTFKDEINEGSRKYFESNRFCFPDGSAVWLLNIKRTSKGKNDCNWGVGPGRTYCDNSAQLEQLPGWDSLQDGAQWGVSRSELVTSALRAWQNNGNKNGWKSADPTTQEGRDEILENGINSLGMVNIPVCSIEEALKNAWPHIKTDNWPCN